MVRRDSCITQLKDQGTSRTCNESKEEKEEAGRYTGFMIQDPRAWLRREVAQNHYRQPTPSSFSMRGKAYMTAWLVVIFFFSFVTLVTGPRKSLSLKMRDNISLQHMKLDTEVRQPRRRPPVARTRTHEPGHTNPETRTRTPEPRHCETRHREILNPGTRKPDPRKPEILLTA